MERKILTEEEVLRQIDKVTIADILRVAKAVLVNSKLNLAVIGPFKDEAKFQKLLKI